jgi:hypothetical protein
MNTREMATEYRLTQWASVLTERGGSGLSIREYCRRTQIKECVYYYWQRKLAKGGNIDTMHPTWAFPTCQKAIVAVAPARPAGPVGPAGPIGPGMGTTQRHGAQPQRAQAPHRLARGS